MTTATKSRRKAAATRCQSTLGGSGIFCVLEAGHKGLHSALAKSLKWPDLPNATPDILAVLSELVDSPNAKQNDLWDRARAAVAKATGAV